MCTRPTKPDDAVAHGVQAAQDGLWWMISGRGASHQTPVGSPAFLRLHPGAALLPGACSNYPNSEAIATIAFDTACHVQPYTA